MRSGCNQGSWPAQMRLCLAPVCSLLFVDFTRAMISAYSHCAKLEFKDARPCRKGTTRTGNERAGVWFYSFCWFLFLGHAQTLASQLAQCLRPRANPRSYLQETGHISLTLFICISSVTCWAFEPGLLSVVSVLGFRAGAHVAFS